MKIFNKYGEEKFSKEIARNIEKRRKEKPIETTFELVEVIKEVLPHKVKNQKGHPAKQVFQALRICVNDELNVFEKSLNDAIDLLNPKGRISVISFHSLEDRICKHTFIDHSTIDYPKNLPVMPDITPKIKVITKKPILPSEEEILNNNRAHSAKLRVCEKN
jgi:16S rRNA (cytosine1402-N4)-methyltransferase